MLLTITTTHQPANDLGYLLHKHPERFQSFAMSFGKVHVYYPEVSAERCSACLLLDVDAVGMVRGKNADQNFLLAQYVNDRPYAASSFMSVAIAQVFGSALQGRCKDRPELATTAIPLTARIDMLPVRGGERFPRAVFEPLGYEIETVRSPLGERFPEWGESPYFALTVRKTTTLVDLLTHLYVLIPVFDNRKHYWVGDDEMEKLLAKGEGWLAEHPEKVEITRRYLKFQPSLYRMALARLVQEEEPDVGEEDGQPKEKAEEILEMPLSLNEQRLGAVMASLRASGAKRVIDLGCGEGKLIRELLKDKQFEEIVGMDVSVRTLEGAQRRLKVDRFGIQEGEIGIVYTRTGRRFFNEPKLEQQFLERLRATLTAADLWTKLETKWICLDCELMPWSAKAQELLKSQYAAVGAAGQASLPRAVVSLSQVAGRLNGDERTQAENIIGKYRRREEHVDQFIAAYRQYCWSVESLTDLKLAPFHLLAVEGRVLTDKNHIWHMDTLTTVCREDPEMLLATTYKAIDVTDAASLTEGITWWTELTGRGGEGMVVKPLDFILRGRRGLAQPAVKCRGREYLRIIYGPDYTDEENLSRLRKRGLGHKRSLALGEFALGVEGLDRFVRKEPLRRVHECVFGVLALESEPVDPRL